MKGPNYHRRQEIFSIIFDFLADVAKPAMPVSMEYYAQVLNIEVMKLSSISAAMAMSPEALTLIWGNKDGHLMWYQNRAKIAYNDHLPATRIRFTMAEEIAHLLLGHVYHPMYGVFNRQLDKEIYLVHENEARFAAGLLLAHPAFYLEAPLLLNISSISLYSAVSASCASFCLYHLLFYKNEINNHPAYGSLRISS